VTAARHPHRLGRALLALALLLGVTACGLSPNERPREIATADLPADLATPSTSTSVPTTVSPTSAAVTIYYLVQDNGVTRLRGVTREVADATRPRDRLVALLAPPTPEEQAAGVLTSIPADTILLDSEIVEADQELVVDLSRSLFDVQGQELRNAFAQLVWTATELEGVRRVRFLVDGQEFRAPDEDGIEQPGAVARSDYITLAP
jgi:spore germination protein GerM